MPSPASADAASRPQDHSYLQELEYLLSLQKYGIKFGLSKTSNLLRALGDPHKDRFFIHVAGTNGKGSVAAFAVSMLQEAGYRVGLYTSPHLVRFTERMQVNSRQIPSEQAAALIREIREASDPSEPPTFFEAVTAMALTYFAREKTDIDVVEVGMGGRLDATNIIEPLLSVITNISLEHQDFLGRTLMEVAREKAGVIKHYTPLLTGVKQKQVLQLFEDLCGELQAPFFRLGRDMRYRKTARGMHYSGLDTNLHQVEIPLNGAFQQRNAALALGALELLKRRGWSISPEHMRQGIKNTRWPGRLHLISDQPRIILDGAHNPAAMRALCASLTQDLDYEKLILVIGIMADKDARSMLKPVLSLADHVLFTRPRYERAMDPGTLRSFAPTGDISCEVIPSLESALGRAVSLCRQQDLILVCGSLFTIGEALSHLDPASYPAEEI